MNVRKWEYWLAPVLLVMLVCAGTYGLMHRTAAQWRPRLVILMVIDTLRADHLGCYGYSRDTSPNIDRVAREGTLFENVFSQSNTSLFSSLSLMTGRYPERFGALDYSTFHLPDSAETIASVLRSYGFRTGGFVAGGHWKHVFGLGRGFDVYQDSHDFGSFHDTFPLAMQWLENLPRQAPAFMLLHGYDLHSPYKKPLFFSHLYDRGYRGIANEIVRVPDGVDDIYGGDYFIERPVLTRRNGTRWSHGQLVISASYYDILARMKRDNAPHIALTPADVRHISALYDGCIRYADVYVGLLLARLHKLGLDRRTLLVIIGDHGECMGDDGFFGHQSYLRDDQVHVPFIVWGPGGVPAGQRIAQVTQLVDLAPTIWSYALGSRFTAGSSPAGGRPGGGASGDAPAGGGQAGDLCPPVDGQSLRPLIEGRVPQNPDAAAFSEGVRAMMSVRTAGARLLCLARPSNAIPPLGPAFYRYFVVKHGKEQDAPLTGEQPRRLWQMLQRWSLEVIASHHVPDSSLAPSP